MIQIRDHKGCIVLVEAQEITRVMLDGGLTIYGMNIRDIELLRREYIRATGHQGIVPGSLTAALERWPTGYGRWAKEAIAQARWELNLEKFEAAVAEEKERLLKKKPWFPWRINITKL